MVLRTVFIKLAVLGTLCFRVTLGLAHRLLLLCAWGSTFRGAGGWNSRLHQQSSILVLRIISQTLGHFLKKAKNSQPPPPAPWALHAPDIEDLPQYVTGFNTLYPKKECENPWVGEG